MKRFYKRAQDGRLRFRCCACESKYGDDTMMGWRFAVYDDQGVRIQCLDCGAEEGIKC